MAEFDAAWCVDTFKLLGVIPANTADPSTAQIYDFVTGGCRRVQRLLAMHVPQAVRVVPEELVTVNDGVTYTFTVYPIGHVELRDGRDGALLLPTTDWDVGTDGYILEGQTVRWPDGEARTFDDGLWARYVPEHGVVTSTTPPTLTSIALRAAIFDALADWADSGGASDPTSYERRRDRELWGNPRMPGDLGVIHALKTQAFGQGVPATTGRPYRWWRSGDLLRGPS